MVLAFGSLHRERMQCSVASEPCTHGKAAVPAGRGRLGLEV